MHRTRAGGKKKMQGKLNSECVEAERFYCFNGLKRDENCFSLPQEQKKKKPEGARKRPLFRGTSVPIPQNRLTTSFSLSNGNCLLKQTTMWSHSNIRRRILFFFIARGLSPSSRDGYGEMYKMKGKKISRFASGHVRQKRALRIENQSIVEQKQKSDASNIHPFIKIFFSLPPRDLGETP